MKDKSDWLHCLFKFCMKFVQIKEPARVTTYQERINAAAHVFCFGRVQLRHYIAYVFFSQIMILNC